MKVGYFCYRLSGTGPRTRAADIIEAVATESDHEVVVLTNEPENVRGPATVHPISLDDPLSTLATTRRAFADADVVHVPVNMYQVLFVRLVYWGPLVGGVGPGLQPSAFHRYLGRLLRIDKKIKVLEHNKLWDDSGYDTAVCTATIDTDRFYQYDDERVRELRREWGIGDEETVVLYVGALIEEQGAGLVDEMARIARDEDDIRIIVAGDGEMADVFRDREDLQFEGFVDNKDLPAYYNVADVTVAPRRNDKTSNVGLESIACGTPMISTAQGHIVDLFKDRGTYVWADRTPEAVLETVRELTGDPEYYQAQVERGLQTMEEMPLSLENAVQTHLDVYAELARGRD
ncbi:glycosyltransferase family 4 protein [Halosimplex aquaticum]|uniref:Glycosyltransferase family 4 protein n=1 Tax=Halosimplex aquaticum TaxID=3026162 RepID=A0ABD5Y2U7_9EURY|nr:glycosyltransferase family 4 protein [Halosimplex aquaticum]